MGTNRLDQYMRLDDGSHSWVKVPMQELADLGLANKISRCSYVKGDFAYLEEDCDLAVWIVACLKAYDHHPIIVTKHLDDPFSKDNPRNFKPFPQTEKYSSECWKEAHAFYGTWVKGKAK